MTRWKRITLPGNDGEPVVAWTKNGYLTYLNVNHGQEPPRPRCGQRDRRGNYWWFEVFTVDPRTGLEGEHIGEAPNLDEAKAMADTHKKDS